MYFPTTLGASFDILRFLLNSHSHLLPMDGTWYHSRLGLLPILHESPYISLSCFSLLFVILFPSPASSSVSSVHLYSYFFLHSASSSLFCSPLLFFLPPHFSPTETDKIVPKFWQVGTIDLSHPGMCRFRQAALQAFFSYLACKKPCLNAMMSVSSVKEPQVSHDP